MQPRYYRRRTRETKLASGSGRHTYYILYVRTCHAVKQQSRLNKTRAKQAGSTRGWVVERNEDSVPDTSFSRGSDSISPFSHRIAAAANGSILSDRESTPMSFLLRKPRGVPAARVPPPGGHRNVASKGKSAAATQSSSRSAGGGQQQQLLLQRRPVQQTHKMIQSSKQKTQQVSTEAQKELQGVISMEEGTTFDV